jgi:asparagine synthase (glutamine-hydrolysing)
VDPQLVEFAARLPSNTKIRGRELKSILRKTASRYLPKELINREKQGFGFPIGKWMRTDLNHFLRKLFSESRFVQLGIFRQEAIDQYLDEHMSGQVDHNFRLWILLNLEFWYRIYFDNMSIDEMHEYTERLMHA